MRVPSLWAAGKRRRAPFALRRLLPIVFFAPASLAWAAADLQVSDYSWSPNNVARSAETAFTVRATNNGPDTVGDAVLTIEVSPNFVVGSEPGAIPAYCVLAGAAGAQTLTCNLPSLASGANQNVVFTATAQTAGAAVTSAAIDSATVSDGNSLNNQLSVTPAVSQGADMTVAKDDGEPDDAIPAGGVLTYTLTAHNAGPDAASGVRVVDNLPAMSDFQYESAGGSGWSCSRNGAVVTCDYAGSAPIGNLPPVTIAGVVRATGGTITNNASVSLTGAVIDPLPGNNSAPAVTTQIQPGSDLMAEKAMSSPLIVGEAGTITLTIHNVGPAAVANATIQDELAPQFTLGALPSGCVAAGQVVTCTASAPIASGGRRDFSIPVMPNAPTGGSQINSARVSPPAGLSDPVPGNDVDNVTFQVTPPNADLSVGKSKGPNPVEAGEIMTSTIVVTNHGPSALTYGPGSPLRVVDTVTAEETYDSVDAPWSCGQAGLAITCDLTTSGSLAVGASTTLVLRTRAGTGVDLNLTNTACSGAQGGSLATPADLNTANDCTGAGVRSTPEEADLQITKEVSLSPSGPWTQGPLAVPTSAAQFYVRLQVRNASGDVARTVVVTDQLPNFIDDDGFTTGFGVESATAGTPSYDPAAGRVSWTVSDLNAGDVEAAILRIERPVESGAFVNEAIVTSPDTTETNLANNTSSASYDIAAITDVAVNSKTITPSTAQTGVVSKYTISIRNFGANPAQNVVLTDTIPPARFDLVGEPVSSKPGSVCSTNAGTGEVSCNLGTVGRGESFQVEQEVRPRFPFGGSTSFPISHTNTAEVATSTFDSNATNDSDSVTHQVTSPGMDLAISKQEPGPEFDPLPYGDELVYDLRVVNLGPSRASNIEITDTPSPPPGYGMDYVGFAVNQAPPATGQAYTPPSPGCTDSGSTIVCRLHASDPDQNYLDPGREVVLRLRFAPTGGAPIGSLTFTNAVKVEALEQDNTTVSQADTQLANNAAQQTTTVLPSTDLEVVSNTRIGSGPVSINEAVQFEVVIRNNGPSPTTQVRLTNALPTGWVLVGTPTYQTIGGTSVSSISCTGSNVVECVLDGQFPAANGQATVTFTARAAYPYSGPLESDVTKTATISPGRDGSNNPLSRDSEADNNSKSAAVQVQDASVTGIVYRDNNRNNVIDAGERIAGVTVAVSGADAFGNTITPVAVQTDANGVFLVDRLPPGTYQLVETQPGGHFDLNETAGDAGGSVNNGAYGSGAAVNTIGGVTLAAGQNASGYIFQELQAATVEGYIYRDLDNDGDREAGEAGFAPGEFAASPHVRITGTDYAGNPVTLNQSVNAQGRFTFANLPPSDASGYTVTELAQPNGASDGLDGNGEGVVVAGSRGRPAPEDIVLGQVAAGAALTERNFGELPTSSLSGAVFLDADSDAVRDAAESTGLANAQVRLTGTNDLGQAVDCVITTDATGAYSFPVASDPSALCQVLRPGTYSLTETPPAGLTHTGAYIGSAGGTSGGVSGANTAAPGPANTVISNIIVAAGVVATNYNFGETGQGLSGFVYVDRDGSGVRQGGEPGIPGVTVTLSGLTASGQDVCTVVNCTAVTDAAGAFAFLAVPGSNGAGYTLTEQAQASPPLSNYGDGQDAVGMVGGAPRGVAGNDVISQIVLAVGELGANYAFGERAGSLAGEVYVDTDDDGVRQPGEPPIASVTVTLSGTTDDGQEICAWRAALNPSLSCTATTDASGAYSFGDLPAGDYTLTETQPSEYADGREAAGSPGGTVNNGAFGGSAATNRVSNIALAAGQAGTGYGFGERAVTISGRVFKDPERDGVDAGGEPGRPGVTINLIQGGTVIATTATGPDGGYSFANLPAGTYTVQEGPTPGYGSSSPNDVTVNLSAGGAQDIDFADTVSTIAGHVFVDSSNDGVRQPGEAAIEGVTIRLTGTDAAGQPVDRQAVTDAAGEYRFDDVLAGAYTLTETQPAGFSDGLDTAGSAGGAPAGDAIGAIALPEGVDAIDYAFGERGQGLTGRVYVDLNRSGAHDAGDPPLAGVTVQLQKPDGSVVATTTTATDGSYSFADIEAGDYVVVEQQPAGYGEAAENPTNRAPVTVGADQPPAPVNFGERTGSIAGAVYNDTNGDGLRQPNEPAIGGVTLTLSGADARGEAVTQTVVTGPDGAYVFTGVAGGAYTVTETQPTAYQDGADTPGTAGGAAGGGDAIGGITLGPGQDATGYLFGETGESAQLSGTIWLDRDHDRARDQGEPVMPAWTVELMLGETVVATTVSGADGAYSFGGVAPGSGYRLRFRNPDNNAAFGGARPNETGAAFAEGVVSPANPAGARAEEGELEGLTLAPGANTPQQSLPLDPSGVVYDSVRRTAVEGATVEIVGPPGFDPVVHLVGGTANVRQVTDALGAYQFWLTASAPAGAYSLRVTPPNGSYNPVQPSSIIPPCAGTLTVGPTPDPMLVSASNGPPPTSAPASCAVGAMSTGYYLSFLLTPGVSANAVNNNIPIDPILQGAIEVTKTTPMTNVSRAGLVPYVITARNTLAGAITGITVTDRVPAGFRYRSGSARIGGVPAEPVEAGRLLSWPAQDFAAGEEKRLELILVVGSGVGEGEHTNQAFAVNTAVDAVVSNLAEATVRIIPDPDFDCTDILGKVFNDLNANGVQDEGEPGLPGVRLATARGLLVTADAEGRYHITCPMIPNEDRGSNFILKLDERTLPTGYRITTGNPETVRLTRGKFAKLNFGASLHRVVRLDLSGEAFDGEAVKIESAAKVEALIVTLAEKPSVLRMAFAAQGEDKGLVQRRMAAMRALIEDRWKEDRERYRLVIEEEAVVPASEGDAQ